MAVHSYVLRLGAPGSDDSESRRGCWRQGASAFGRLAGGNGALSSSRQGVVWSRTSLPQGDAELLARAVRLLRHPRLASDQQWLGTTVRESSLSRTSSHRTQSCVASTGATWVSSVDRRCGDSAAAVHGGGPSPSRFASLAAAAVGVG